MICLISCGVDYNLDFLNCMYLENFKNNLNECIISIGKIKKDFERTFGNSYF